MVPPEDDGRESDGQAFLEDARERIAARKAELQKRGAEDAGPDSTFRERYDHLVGELGALLETLEELEVEPHGSSGLSVRFAPTDREVRITALEEQGFVHFVFGHATLGTLHRAEHHATRPFGDRPPDVPKLARQLLAFLVEGVEPGWLARRSSPDGQNDAPPTPADGGDDEELELPLE
ncbi:MAG: hypothetical protein R3199_11385 [Gemmatimonadota bacterium]|nr:hypothetical protein [Gemmatimonadota bacterium]